jgi:3-keto-5-aminohexanoate cleavage enzyme
MSRERRKIVVSVAPVGTNIAPPAINPYTPEEVAADVIAAARAGAGMVHLHVRDRQGQQTEDLTEFSRTLDLIREQSDIIIQGSTGGLVSLTREERCVSLNDPRVEVASLNMGSANVGEGVYINTLPDIRFWAQRIQERQIVPELEIFEAGMISNVPRLLADGLLTPPIHFNFVLGFEGPLPADPRNLFFLQTMLPKQATWGMVHDNMTDFRLLATAIGLGATVARVGFEDSVTFAPGEIAKTNAELVANVVELINCLGGSVATPAEARKLLNIHT